MSYYHLTINNRKDIERYFKQGKKITEIANLMGFHKSTISRELKRNLNNQNKYNAIGADRKANARHKNCGRKAIITIDKKAYEIIATGLDLYFSPEEIANSMPKNHKVSTCTIYRALKQKLFDKYLHKKLRRYGKNNKKGTKKGICYDFSQVRTLDQRNSSVFNRNRFGHWELDTIILHPENGYHLATFVERKSRYLLMRKIPNKKAVTMSNAIIDAFKTVPEKYRLSLTVDRGLEFTDWQRVEKELNTKVYFCDPYSPWQRGSNENTNGLIRQFFPRGKVFKQVTSDDVSFVQYLLNIRPRKCLNWKSPISVFCCT
ncbi:MAG: IS30 family transposase [Clostridia bacterium]